MATDDDTRFIRRALTLARRGKHTHPNPKVGAVVVKNGVIVGEGYHIRFGLPHAETVALSEAGDAARGATIYVTLEPCFHRENRDGSPRTPCADRCIEAGIARVVCAMVDPDSRVSGRGIERLRDAGTVVTVGVLEADARTLNRPFIKHRETGLPFVLHKAAMTLDGKIATASGSSRWITGVESREYVHKILRTKADAVVVGIGTVLADDPSLTVRSALTPIGRTSFRLSPLSHQNGRGGGNAGGERSSADGGEGLEGRGGGNTGNRHAPLRVVIDSGLRTPIAAKVAAPGTLIYAIESPEARTRATALAETGAQVAYVAADGSGRVDVEAAMRDLAGRGALSVLLEAGGELAASFYAARLVDTAQFFVAPKIVGGQNAPTPIGGAGLVREMSAAISTGAITVKRFGADIALFADIRYDETTI